MWWECSECGDLVERARPPVLCRECGTAGVIFVPADVRDRTSGHVEGEDLRAMWVRAGAEQAQSGRMAG